MNGKMKLLSVSLVISVLIAALIPGSVLAQENKTYFSGTECFVEITDPGTWIPLHDGLFRVIGYHSTQFDDTTDARLNGYDYVTLNAVGDPVAGNGTFWGTFNVVNEGGSWEGPWVGKQENGAFTINGLLHGQDGYEGLVANWSYTSALPCAVISGYIVETGAGN